SVTSSPTVTICCLLLAIGGSPPYRRPALPGLETYLPGLHQMRSEALGCEPPQTAQDVPPAPVGAGRSGRTLARARPLRPALAYRGGNCECGAGGARLAVGAWAVKPITAQLMSTPTEP